MRGTIAPYGSSEALAVWADEGSRSHLGYAVVDVLGGLQDFGVALNAEEGCLETSAVAVSKAVVVAARCNNPTLWVTAYQDGAWVPGLPISTQGSNITGPALGTDGTVARLVWSDDRSGSPRLYGTRLDPDGGSLDDGGAPVAVANGDQTRPSIASSGGTWLLAWEESQDDAGTRVLGNRFGADWQPLDPEPLVLRESGSKAGAPRLLSVNGGFLMAWEEYTHLGDVRAAMVDVQGAVGESFDLAAGPEWEGQVSLAPGRSETEVLAAYSALDPASGMVSRRAYTRWIDLTGGPVTGDDAGILPPHDPFGIGCDCSSAGGSAVWVAALVLAVAAARGRLRLKPRRSAPRS
jgi:MYXO-CTERM domain-containing protein